MNKKTKFNHIPEDTVWSVGYFTLDTGITIMLGTENLIEGIYQKANEMYENNYGSC